MAENKDQKDYQDYLDYQNYLGTVSNLASKSVKGELPKGSLEGLKSPMAAFVGGLGQGLTGGYGKRALSQGNLQTLEKAQSEHPFIYGAGNVAGALAPGAALAKGIGMLGLGSATSGLIAGGIEGAAVDPGGNGIEPEQRAINSGVGAIAGGSMGLMNNLGNTFSKYMSLGKAGTADEVSGQIKSALGQAREQGFNQPARDAQELMRGKTVQINRDRLLGVSPRLDEFVQNRIPPPIPGRGYIDMDAVLANRLRKHTQNLANYRSKLFGSPEAGDQSAEAAASMLRNKTHALDPMIPKLQAEASANIGKVNALENATAQSPIEGLTSQPLGTRGSVIADIDKMGGSDLTGLATELRSARSMAPSLAPQSMLRPLDVALRSGKLVAGASAAPFSKYAPRGTKEAVIAALLEQMRNK